MPEHLPISGTPEHAPEPQTPETLAEQVFVVGGERVVVARVPWIRPDGSTSVEPDTVFTKPGTTDRFRYLGARPDGTPAVVRLAEAAEGAAVSVSRVKTKQEQRSLGEVSPDKARDIMGEGLFFGREALQTTFGIENPDIPKIPFSAQELQEAAERKEMLILRVAITDDGEPLTIQKMEELAQPRMTTAGKETMISGDIDYRWYKTDPFFTIETPRASWALVSSDVIPNTTSKHYLDQTRTLIQYLTTVVFKNKLLPLEYQEAIAAFTTYDTATFGGKTPQEVQQLLQGTEWKIYAEQLVSQPITQLLRPTAPELISDIATVVMNTDTRILSSMWAFTATRSSDGLLVSLGAADASGLNVDGVSADSRGGNLGALLSLRR